MPAYQFWTPLQKHIDYVWHGSNITILNSCVMPHIRYLWFVYNTTILNSISMNFIMENNIMIYTIDAYMPSASTCEYNDEKWNMVT